MHSTKIAFNSRWQLRQQSRRPTKPAALPCPPYVPFSWTAIVGSSNGGEVLMIRVLHLRPHPSAQEKGGRPVRPRKNSAREKVFLRPRSAYRAFPCGKRKAPTPPPMCRGQGGALLFSADAAEGRGRRRHVR